MGRASWDRTHLRGSDDFPSDVLHRGREVPWQEAVGVDPPLVITQRGRTEWFVSTEVHASVFYHGEDIAKNSFPRVHHLDFTVGSLRVLLNARRWPQIRRVHHEGSSESEGTLWRYEAVLRVLWLAASRVPFLGVYVTPPVQGGSELLQDGQGTSHYNGWRRS